MFLIYLMAIIAVCVHSNLRKFLVSTNMGGGIQVIFFI